MLYLILHPLAAYIVYCGANGIVIRTIHIHLKTVEKKTMKTGSSGTLLETVNPG
jgi:hypothetical protein